MRTPDDGSTPEDPPDPDRDDPALALVHEGWDHLQLQRPLAAWASWQRALRIDPDDPAAPQALDAPRVGRRPARRGPRASTGSGRPRTTGRRGPLGRGASGAATSDDLADAADAFAALADDDPADAAARYNQALCLAWLGRNAEAIEASTASVRLLAGADLDARRRGLDARRGPPPGGGAEAPGRRPPLRLDRRLARRRRARLARRRRPTLRRRSPPRDPVTGRAPVDGGRGLRVARPAVPEPGRPAPASPTCRGPGHRRRHARLAPALQPRSAGRSTSVDDRLPGPIGDPARPSAARRPPCPCRSSTRPSGRFRLPAGSTREAARPLTREAVEHYYEDRWIHQPAPRARRPLRRSRPAGARRGGRRRRPGQARGGRPAPRAARRPGPGPPACTRAIRSTASAAGSASSRSTRRSVDADDLACMSAAELDRLDPAALDDVRLVDAFESAAGPRATTPARPGSPPSSSGRDPPALARLDLAALFAPSSARRCGRTTRARPSTGSTGPREVAAAAATAGRSTSGAPRSSPGPAIPTRPLRSIERCSTTARPTPRLALDAAETLLDNGHDEHARRPAPRRPATRPDTATATPRPDRRERRPEALPATSTPIAPSDATVTRDRRPNSPFLSALKWTADGLVPAIVQDAETGEVLMMAWMDEPALAPDAGDRPDALLLAVAAVGLAQGGDLGARPARRVDPGRLRRRRPADQGPPGRRGLPRGLSLLLLPPGRRRRAARSRRPSRSSRRRRSTAHAAVARRPDVTRRANGAPNAATRDASPEPRRSEYTGESPGSTQPDRPGSMKDRLRCGSRD